MLKFLACIFALCVAPAASAVCQWTSEQRDDYFRKDPTYMDPPVIQRQACKPDLAPICSGFAYCPQPGIPRRRAHARGPSRNFAPDRKLRSL